MQVNLLFVFMCFCYHYIISSVSYTFCFSCMEIRSDFINLILWDIFCWIFIVCNVLMALWIIIPGHHWCVLFRQRSQHLMEGARKQRWQNHFSSWTNHSQIWCHYSHNWWEMFTLFLHVTNFNYNHVLCPKTA